ncbi:hypothetical protein [Enterococcus sp. 5H]|uniref:hypothetical protein n=1 Tax=Enterococcus sp. 5H TaxID=1229490 RepID=UPI002302082B|nr:hypothetical protein [Enterococcus sp. 5H]MDA9472660.1 hypothetical protein [Enterococcus sp. 5H]
MTKKLTKVGIRSWLQGKRGNQLSELREKQAKEENAFRVAFAESQGFTALYDKYEPIIQEFKKEWDAIYDGLIENEIVNTCYYTLVGDKLRQLVGKGSIGNCDIEYINIISDDYKKLIDDQEADLDTVREEWQKLISNVNAITSVKKILIYLNDIGIDTSEIEPVEEPMLPATPIEVSILKL